MSLTVGALFAGYGGLELALRSALDVRLAWYAEVDPAAAAVMAHHWPGAPNLGDVTKVDWSTVEPVDIITGGSPCQDLSTAGKRAGMRPGSRSGLWASMHDAITILRPRLVVWENVKGALSAGADSAMEQCPRCVGGPGRREPALRALGRVLGDLSEVGYDSWWATLRAADVGAAHGRSRVFLFASPAGDPRRSGGLEAVEHDGRRAPECDRSGVLDEPDREPLWDGPERALTLLPTPAVNDMGSSHDPASWDEWTARMRAKHGNGNGHGKSLSVEAQRLLPTPRASDGTKGGPNQRGSSGDLMLPSGVQPDRWGQYADAVARHEAVFGRPAPDPTEVNAKGKLQLSPRFCEWLMMLPDGWVTDPAIGITRNAQLKILGNGVVPPQAAAALGAYLADVTS